MLSDKLLTLSKDQAITVSAASSDFINMRGITILEDPMDFLVTVTETFSGGTSTAFSIQDDSSSGFATNLTTISSHAAIATATLVSGYQFVLTMPKQTQKYVRAYYTVVGTNTAGKVTVQPVYSMQTNGASVTKTLEALL